MRKSEKFTHRGCDISYSVYGEGSEYSANSWIAIHAENDIEHELSLKKNYNSPKEAEAKIIEVSKKWIDDQIDVLKRFKSI